MLGFHFYKAKWMRHTMLEQNHKQPYVCHISIDLQVLCALCDFENI